MSHCHRRTFIIRIGLSAALGVLPAWASAQGAAWPATTKIVVPLPAGGGVDAAARKLAEKLAPNLGTAVIVENKTGASGLIAAKAVSSAAGDGATVFYLHSGLVTVQAMSGRLDLLKEFKLVTKISTSPHLLVVPGNSPYKTQAELIAAIQAKPGKLNYGSGGSGSPSHLMMVQLAERVPGGLNATHVPFKGGAAGVMSLIAGEVDFGFMLPGSVAEHIKSGKLRVLSTTGVSRMPQFPNAPTVAEAGVAGYHAEPWGGLAVPAKTPDALVARLEAATKSAVASREFGELLMATGSKSELSASPSAFTESVRSEIASETALVNRLGIKAE